MRQYYFLNSQKQWCGPYWFPQVLFYTLIGAIKPYTYLWHNELAKDGCEHPLNCIYDRKKAFEFGFLPFWLFGSNLKIIATNLINWIKKGLKKKDSWDKLLQKPIETPSVLNDATNVFLTPSLTAIHDFGGTGEFVVKLIYIERETKDVKSLEYPVLVISDKKPGIRFEITMAELPQVGGVLHKESYGLHHHLLLRNGYEDISVAKDCVFDFSTRFPYKPQILKGRFSQANLIASSDYKNTYNRLVLKIEDDKLIGPLDIIMRSGSHLYDYEKFNVHPSLMGMSFRTGGGYAEVIVEEKHYRFYDVADSIYLIDGIDREDLEIFKQKTEIIRIALAILSGKFYGGQCNYVTSDTPQFTNIEGVWYEIERNSVLSNRRVIDLHLFRTTFKETDTEYIAKFKPVNKAVDSALFSDLCNALWKDENLLHAAELVISGMGNSDPVQQGALYSVALETLTSTLGDTKAKDLRPVDDDTVFKNLKEDLFNGLENYKAGISQDGFTILQRKIESLNTPANQDKLTKTFELFGITPTEEDKKAIKNRNSYLHGRSPLNRTQQFELTQISLKLHTLIVSLLLKSVGYSGHIINLEVHVYLTNEDKLRDIVSEQSSTIKKYLAEMQKVSDAQDETAFNSTKEKLAKYLEENKLSNMVRII